MNKQIYTTKEIALLEAHSARPTNKYICNIIKSLKKISNTENDQQALEKIYDLFELTQK